ncbi:MAG: hypothetical protein COT25_04525 [Candidatus Kerfeldbacteria bacterium CG08_land_8_20_14_0_20_42_7]|uniref:IPT/TIG domain-containing protein n=1 Tax=Candidatus Kerfeldbacteria bacterium CG08_land_8_20_14_0_20_42_7 TaxID=2014245 RepID=A0A2H0YRV7_9BACT|nr:MAG: hypothetical protein COT25_04525 [Candidatus Kerfeldbacteria bacterium CG08_land_8_20_14_0_20_42_7]
MNKKVFYMLLTGIIVLLIAGGAWYFLRDTSISNTNSLTVNSTNAPANLNINVIPQSEEYIFIFGVDPLTGLSGTQATIQGSGFIDGLQVFFGENEASNVTVTDGKSLSVTIPEGEGTVNIKIINPDGRSGILYDGFVYNAGA